MRVQRGEFQCKAASPGYKASELWSDVAITSTGELEQMIGTRHREWGS